MRLVTSVSIAIAIAVLLPVAASAQTEAPETWRPPTLTTERYNEDWSKLEDPANRTGRWTEPFKYIPLDASGADYLTSGVELRARYEGYDNPGWSGARDEGYLWLRALPYADLHVGRVRFFAQPIIAYATGVKPSPGPVDQTSVDLLQGFADVVEDLGPNATIRVEVGRQLFGLGTERLVGTRYGPNVPLAFDGVRTIIHLPNTNVGFLYLKPVEGGPKAFDDEGSSRRALWGAYGTHWFTEDRKIGIDAYYLGYRNDHAVFDQGAGREVRHTYGVRFFGSAHEWHWNVEGGYQDGRFATGRISAWSVATEFGRTLPTLPFKPDFTMRADIISGDRDRDHPGLQTFNPLFPKGQYFGTLSPVGPYNIIDAHPQLALAVGRKVSFSVAGMAYWRQSTQDGIYDIPGHLLRSGAGSDARFIGKGSEVALAWRMTPELTIAGSLSVFYAGQFVRDTGPAPVIKMAGLESNFRF